MNKKRSLTISGGSPTDQTVHPFYYKSKCFENFHYVKNQAEECKKRAQKIEKNLEQGTLITRDVWVMLRFVGKVTEDNRKHVPHRKGNI